MNHGSLFSGIGGFDLAAQWMGWNNVFHCELMPFPRKILNYYWPDSISYEDITKTDFTIHRDSIDVLTGGFPCQPYSSAGKRLGKDDERHLWPEMLRAIKEIEPRWIVGENVRGLTNWNGGVVFEEVCADLENCGYQVQPILLPACAVGAPHRRDRIWFIAYRNSNGFNQCDSEYEEQPSERRINAFDDIIKNDSSYSEGIRQENALEIEELERRRFRESGERNYWDAFPSQPPICGGNDGLPTRLDGIAFPKWRSESIKGYGNAVVPQLVYQIFKVIKHDSQQ